MNIRRTRGATLAIATALALLGLTAAASAAPRSINPDNTFSCHAPGGDAPVEHCGSVLVPAHRTLGIVIKDAGGSDSIAVMVRINDGQVGLVCSNLVSGSSCSPMFTNDSDTDKFVGAYFKEDGWWGGQTVTGHFTIT